VISWGEILYGAVLSAIAAGVGLLLVARRLAPVTAMIAGVASAFAAPVAWNAILRATHANRFFTDAPIAAFPISWQDTGSGVFTFALATLAIAAVAPRLAARRLALVAGVAALVDVYLY
jgi:hypothetical protein